MDLRSTSPLVLVLVAGLGCGSRVPEPCQPVGHTTTTAAPIAHTAEVHPSAIPGALPASLDLYLARREQDTCAMQRVPAITFAFAEEQLSPGENQQLLFLARCLTEGRLAHSRLVLIGSTEPSGDESRALEAGLRNAKRAKDLLVERGVDAERVLVTSAGSKAPSGGVAGERIDVFVAEPPRGERTP